MRSIATENRLKKTNKQTILYHLIKLSNKRNVKKKKKITVNSVKIVININNKHKKRLPMVYDYIILLNTLLKH